MVALGSCLFDDARALKRASMPRLVLKVIRRKTKNCVADGCKPAMK